MDIIQGSVAGKACYSVDEFCTAHSISRAMFYKLRADGKKPKFTEVPTNKGLNLHQRPIFWAAVVAAVFIVLNVVFW